MSITAIKAPQTSTQEARERFQFRDIRGSTGIALDISTIHADYSKSKSMIEEAGLVLLTRQNALLILMNDEVLKESLKGKWFYLAGEGIEKSRIYTIDQKGELIDAKEGLSIERKVRVWSGPHTLSLLVSSDYYAARDHRRFDLFASAEPEDVAPVVVGIEPSKVERVKQSTSLVLRGVSRDETRRMLDNAISELESYAEVRESDRVLKTTADLLRRLEIKE
jgi:hypothetical protein